MSNSIFFHTREQLKLDRTPYKYRQIEDRLKVDKSRQPFYIKYSNYNDTLASLTR